MNKIGYLTFGRDDFSYGIALALNSVSRENKFRVTPKTAHLVDFLCFSVFWWEHIYLLADFLRRAGIKKGGSPRIIIGGFNSFNPVPLFCYADAVICGDAEEAFPAILRSDDHPGIYLGATAIWQNVKPLKAFCNETNDIARIELARGCKYRCKFCAVAYLKPYREVSAEEIKILIQLTNLKRVSLFAPEPTMHSRNGELTEFCNRLGKVRTDSDVRLDHLSKRDDSVPRVGIEGLSERLRKSVKKPYKNSQIVGAIKDAIAMGRKGLFMYFILDLPGEEDSDWLEFRGLLEEIGKLPGAIDFLLKPSPSVFMPTPHTPMELDGIHWERDYATKWKYFFGRGNDREWEVMIAERSRVFSPAARVLSMVATRAGEEFAEIETELTKGKIIGVSGGRVHCKSEQGLLGVLRKYGGVERYCGPYTETPPWKSLQVGESGAPILRKGGDK